MCERRGRKGVGLLIEVPGGRERESAWRRERAVSEIAVLSECRVSERVERGDGSDTNGNESIQTAKIGA